MFKALSLSILILSSQSFAIVGGNSMKPGEFDISTEVAFLNMHFRNRTTFCSGTFIGDQIVMTAAHCLEEFRRERLGAFPHSRPSMAVESNWKVNGRGQAVGGMYEAVEYLSHPSYVGLGRMGVARGMSAPNADIALIKLKSPRKLPEGENIAVTRVAVVSKPPKPGMPVMSFGYGAHSPPPPPPQEFFRQYNEGTQESYSGLNQFGLQTTTFIVAGRDEEHRRSGFKSPLDAVVVVPRPGNDYQSLCHGDSGGPTLAKSGSQWLVVGVTSYGQGCRGATALTSVAYHYKWIKEVAARWNTPIYEWNPSETEKK